jgi:hypothetical protein
MPWFGFFAVRKSIYCGKEFWRRPTNQQEKSPEIENALTNPAKTFF